LAGRRRSIKKTAKKSLLPTTVTEFLSKSLIRLWGAILVVLFFGSAVAFFSYDINDPSWNNAVDGNANNLLGEIGSYGADILMQSLGLGAYVLALPLLTWGWRIISLKGLPFIFMHLLMLPLLVISAVLSLSTIPTYQTWPLDNVGLGGFLGQRLLGYVQSFFAWSGIDFYPLIISGVFGLLTIICFMYTAGLERDEWIKLYSGIKWGIVSFFSKLFASLLFIKGIFAPFWPQHDESA